MYNVVVSYVSYHFLLPRKEMASTFSAYIEECVASYRREYICDISKVNASKRAKLSLHFHSPILFGQIMYCNIERHIKLYQV